MVIAAIFETGKDLLAFVEGAPSLDAKIKPTERIRLSENELLEVFPDGKTLLFDQHHAALLVGRRADGKKQI